MKKIKLTFIGIIVCMGSLLLLSCGSDDNMGLPGQEPEATKVNFILEDFWEEISPLKSTTPLGESSIHKLYYYVHNKSDGKLIKRIEFCPTDQNRNFVDKLVPGDYYITFVGTFRIYNHDGGWKEENDNYHTARFKVSGCIGDAFFSTFEITIGNAPFDRQVTMERIVGRIEVFVKDAVSLPENIEFLSLVVRGTTPTWYTFETQETQAASLLFQPVTWMWEREAFKGMVKDNPMYFCMLPTGTEPSEKLSLYLRCRYKSSKDIIEKDILIMEGVDIYRNKITRLSGDLFDGANFLSPIKIQDEWSAEVIEESFDE